MFLNLYERWTICVHMHISVYLGWVLPDLLWNPVVCLDFVSSFFFILHFKYLFIVHLFFFITSHFSVFFALRITCNVLENRFDTKKNWYTDEIERRKKQILEIVLQFFMLHPYWRKKWCQWMNFEIVNSICIRFFDWSLSRKIRVFCTKNVCELKIFALKFWNFSRISLNYITCSTNVD